MTTEEDRERAAKEGRPNAPDLAYSGFNAEYKHKMP